MNLAITVFRANTDQEIDATFEAIAQQRVPALVAAANPFFDTRRKKLVALAARNAVPAIYHFREYADDGGLMSYGLNFADVYRLVGVYTGKVLKGTKTERTAGYASDQIRVCHQSQDRQGARRPNLRQFALTRRRGDRVMRLMTGFGAKGRSGNALKQCPLSGAFGIGIADIGLPVSRQKRAGSPDAEFRSFPPSVAQRSQTIPPSEV
jgi:hypothetical protein